MTSSSFYRANPTIVDVLYRALQVESILHGPCSDRFTSNLPPMGMPGFLHPAWVYDTDIVANPT